VTEREQLLKPDDPVLARGQFRERSPTWST
jgi:hypothetical protein